MHLEDSPVFAHRLDAVVRESRSIADEFAKAGRRLYLVGGIVRDLLVEPALETDDPDFDFTTDAPPAEIKRIVGPISESLWTQGERFGTIGAVHQGRRYEITTHRAESYDAASRKPRVNYGTDLRADLARRDFSINAIAIEVTATTPEIIDPYDGRADLLARRLRTPIAPAESFSDDPLRMLRAARFIARFALTADPDVTEAVQTMRDRLAVVSVERIRDEFTKLLCLPDPSAGLQFLADTGLLDLIVPGLTAPSTVNALISRVTASAPRLTVRLVAMLGVDPVATRERLNALRASNDLSTRVVELTRLRSELAGLPDDPSAGALRRLAWGAGEELGDGLELLAVDDPEAASNLSRRFAELAAAEDLSTIGPGLDGHEVAAHLGVDPGPIIGQALTFLIELRLDEGPLDRHATIERLDAWWLDRQSGVRSTSPAP